MRSVWKGYPMKKSQFAEAIAKADSTADTDIPYCFRIVTLTNFTLDGTHYVKADIGIECAPMTEHDSATIDRLFPETRCQVERLLNIEAFVSRIR